MTSLKHNFLKTSWLDFCNIFWETSICCLIRYLLEVSCRYLEPFRSYGEYVSRGGILLPLPPHKAVCGLSTEVQSEAAEGAMGPAEGAVVSTAPVWLRVCGKWCHSGVIYCRPIRCEIFIFQHRLFQKENILITSYILGKTAAFGRCASSLQKLSLHDLMSYPPGKFKIFGGWFNFRDKIIRSVRYYEHWTIWLKFFEPE